MPEVIEVTVYKLDELKQFGDQVYRKAIQNVLEDDTSGDWCQWLTQDINEWFNDGPGKLEEGESPFDDGKIEEWYAAYRTVSYRFAIEPLAYLKRKKLHMKLRTLYNWLSAGWDSTMKSKAGTSLRNRDNTPYFDDDLDSDLRQSLGYCQDDARIKRLDDQIDAMLEELKTDVEAVTEKLRNWVHDEWMWRYTDEFAVQEAEGLELVFTQGGKIFRKPHATIVS